MFVLFMFPLKKSICALHFSSIQTFDFSNLYTTILHKNVKENMHTAFDFKNGKQRCKSMLLGHQLAYLIKHKKNRCHKENEPVSMLKFLIRRVRKAHFSINHRHPQWNKLFYIFADISFPPMRQCLCKNKKHCGILWFVIILLQKLKPLFSHFSK